MVLSIVRQSVQFKLKSRTESPLISEAEYCCACGEGLRALGNPDGLLERVKVMSQVKEVQDLTNPYFQAAMEQEEEKSVKKRLYHLLVYCRVEGEITEEIRVLFDKE